MSNDTVGRDWDEIYDAIQARVGGVLPEGSPIMFSAYNVDEDNMPIDNLDEVAVVGRCRFIQKHDQSFGGGKDYESAEMCNPTWLQVCKVAHEMIQVTGDDQHIFLEGVAILGEKDGVKIVDLEMGS